MKNKHKPKDLDRYVKLCLMVLILYTIVGIVVQIITSQEVSPTLTTCVYGSFGGELFLLAMIKKLKIKRGDSNDGNNCE